MEYRIVGSSKNELGEVSVFFGNENTNDAYYAHSITSIGDEADQPSRMNTMWAWINHVRSKRWWNKSLEQEFIRETEKHLV